MVLVDVLWLTSKVVFLVNIGLHGLHDLLMLGQVKLGIRVLVQLLQSSLALGSLG